MASTSIDNEDSSEPIIEYFKHKIGWIPNNVNPDFILVISVIGIILDSITIVIILQKLKSINGDIAIGSLLEWIENNYRGLLLIGLILLSLIILLVFSYMVTLRILDENTRLKVPLEEFINFVNEPRVARFYMHLFIMVTGLIMLRELADRSFPVLDTIQFMLAWFVLVLLLPVPEAAKSDIDPFTEIDF